MSEASLKEQRNRFLAFAFAVSDLFLEINEEGTITYAVGAVQGVTGKDTSALIGQHWLEIFNSKDRSLLDNLSKRANPGNRVGPNLVRLNEDIADDNKQVVVNAITMPGQSHFYVSLAFSNVLMSKIAAHNTATDEEAIMDKEGFLNAARDAVGMAQSLGQDADMTLLDIANSKELKQSMDEDQWQNLQQAIASALKSRSIDGQAAAQIADGRYSVVHDTQMSEEHIQDLIQQVTQEKNPDAPTPDMLSKTISSELSELSEREATKALVYTINEFERKGTDLTIDSLNNSFQAYVSANAQKISEFKDMVKQLNFRLNFQPIVTVASEELSHYEVLCRFPDGGSPFEWIAFGEDLGMAAEFDIAIIERAINYITYHASGQRTKFAINVSGQSIADPHFVKKLIDMLKKETGVQNRIMFEITESTHINDDKLSEVNTTVQELKKLGASVCLDDFGAGSASFQYIQQLDVDYVKIDGQYVRKMLESQREAAMIKNLAQMCNDLGIHVIAEMVEHDEQAQRLNNIGVAYAQGFLYARPMTSPAYTPRVS
jgi:EAL domain-containing protein (putative c-di-GMP-specific phosphodiesterase class I)